MGFEEIRRKNEARKQLMQSKINVYYMTFKEDQDCMAFRLVPPYEGYDRLTKTYSGEYKEKPHYRMHPLGDYNLIRGKPISNPQIGTDLSAGTRVSRTTMRKYGLVHLVQSKVFRER